MTAGMFYIITQLAKMLFLATFFPTGDDDFLDGGEFVDREVPFEFFPVSLHKFIKNAKNKL